jgi:hypothetical protein
MKKNALIFLLIGALPTGASAQSADTTYCNALSATYEKYVNNPTGGRGNQPASATISGAQQQCALNPAAGIPVLERVLKDARVNLPPRG